MMEQVHTSISKELGHRFTMVLDFGSCETYDVQEL